MLKESWLWYHTIDPVSGKIVKQETVLMVGIGAAILFLGIYAIVWLAGI